MNKLKYNMENTILFEFVLHEFSIFIYIITTS